MQGWHQVLAWKGSVVRCRLVLSPTYPAETTTRQVVVFNFEEICNRQISTFEAARGEQYQPKMAIIGKNMPETISIPSATLRKMSGSQVDPYTRYVAYILFKDLNITVQGGRNINSALSNLPVHLSVAPDEKLSFGWGLSNVIRNKAVHEGSYEHLALMIAIGESFHEPVSFPVDKRSARRGTIPSSPCSNLLRLTISAVRREDLNFHGEYCCWS